MTDYIKEAKEAFERSNNRATRKNLVRTSVGEEEHTRTSTLIAIAEQLRIANLISMGLVMNDGVSNMKGQHWHEFFVDNQQVALNKSDIAEALGIKEES